MYLQGDTIWYLPVSLAVRIKQKSSNGPFRLLLPQVRISLLLFCCEGPTTPDQGVRCVAVHREQADRAAEGAVAALTEDKLRFKAALLEAQAARALSERRSATAERERGVLQLQVRETRTALVCRLRCGGATGSCGGR